VGTAGEVHGGRRGSIHTSGSEGWEGGNLVGWVQEREASPTSPPPSLYCAMGEGQKNTVPLTLWKQQGLQSKGSRQPSWACGR